MGVSTLARRAAPANRARITGSLRSRRWPSAPPWRRPPTTSAALLRTLSSLGQPEVAGHSNGRAGQAASRSFPQRSEHVRPRVYESYTRGRTCPPSTAESRSFYLCSARALGHWASGRRPAGEEDGESETPATFAWPLGSESAGQGPTRGAPLTIALAQRRRRRNDEAEPLWLREGSEH